MTTKSTGVFTIADVAEILEAAGWDSYEGAVDSTRVADELGNAATLTGMHSGQIVVDFQLADEVGPWHTTAHLTIPESAGALTIARMILAAAATEED